MRSLVNLTDEQIVLDYQQTADMECLGVLYSRYAHLVTGVCMKILDNQDDAYDLTMTLFEKMSQLLKVNKIDNFNRWVYAFSHNESINKLRSRNRQFNKIVLTESFEDSWFTEEEEYQSELDTQEDKLILAVQQLPDIQQQCLSLFYEKKKSYREIADTFQLSENSIKSHLQNGKRMLKKLLNH